MLKTFDSKIKELEKEKSELLDIDFLQSQKKEYEERMYEILDNRNTESDKSNAASELDKATSYRIKIKEINKKIQENPKLLEDINKKISFYQERKERVKNIPLYKDTEEGIAEILGTDPLYQYAKETNNKELTQKIEERSLTIDEYTKFYEKMYEDLFASVLEKQEKKDHLPKKVIILLPEGMSEQIKEELAGNKDIDFKEIERFLKNELKNNNGEIMVSHIHRQFKDKYKQAYEYIKRLIINYPGFKIIENLQNNKPEVVAPTKREKLISQTSPETEEDKIKRLEIERLLSKLDSISERGDLESKIYCYIGLYEELGCNFSDKISFLNELRSAIETYSHIPLERGIQKNLKSIIEGNLHPKKLEKFGYFTYKLGRFCDNWRILMYPNGEMFTICSHADYEKIINRKPPANKV